MGPGSSEEPNTSRPWGDRAISSNKLDMKQIMAQASSSRISNISASLGASSTSVLTSGTGRLSQKERKKQQQQVALERPQQIVAPPTVQVPAQVVEHTSPWQVASKGAKTSLKDILHAESKSPLSNTVAPERAVSNPPLTLRQTIPGNISTAKRTVSETPSKAQAAPPQRSTSTPLTFASSHTPPRPSSSRTKPSPATIGPSSSTPTKSIRHTTPTATAEPSLQLSMADILSQQQTEKDVIREAAMKRSLQEIQEEQAFQE
ncbi:MAG: hypothetical protein Q9193_004486, partial [Seirophora villosa]